MSTTGNDHAEDRAPAEDGSTASYRALLRSARAEWSTLEASGDPAVQASPDVQRAITEVVRAEVRHGRQIELPPTPRGPLTVSELALRTVIRDAVDTVAGARALRTETSFAPSSEGGLRGVGRPVALRCRITAGRDTPELPGLGDLVRHRVADALSHHFQLHVDRIDVHIQDLHDA